MPSQQVTTGPALMERVERTNMVMIQLQQRTGLAQCNPYIIEVDRRKNCYAYGEFGHMACHCRNWGQRRKIEQERRIEYREGIEGNYEHSDNLKEEENLESLD